MRERIAHAALTVVADNGYSGSTVAEVAQRAGVGTGTVYRYFPSKGELFAEVFRNASQREVDAAGSAAERAASACACVALVSAVETFASRALSAPRLAYALLAEPVDPLVDAERLAFRRAYRDLFASSISRGIRAGDFPDQDVDVTAAALVGAVGEALIVPLNHGPSTPKRHAATVSSLVQFTLRSLGGAHHAHA